MRRACVVAVASLALVAPISIAGQFTTEQSARAISGSQFNPGAIISDQAFYDSTAMDSAAIQSFLNSQVTFCRAGYTCLKDYWQATSNKEADANCAAYPAAWQNSATIIDSVARACGISQKVLLVLLQKEQGLITDTWPLESQYRAATGYGCPDTAACDATYYGFFNQIYNAAWQFKQYQAKPANFNYRAGRTNYIRWSPNAACGGSDVYITNQATAGLYMYTPYQPNAAALSNLYGTGDGCSSYGNRNFWRIYTDWFGPTNAFGISGGIGEYYVAHGGASGTGLGQPIGNQYRLPDGIGWSQAFQYGEIYWSPSTGAWIAIGGIGDFYTANGGPGGTGLGYVAGAQTPLNDAASGWVQRYGSGSIYWTPTGGGRAVTGAIAARFEALGGPVSSGLGYPVSTAHAVLSGRSQAFEYGRLYSTGSSAYVVSPTVSRVVDAVGGVIASGLGLPTADATRATDGGLAQPFSVGGVYGATDSSLWVVPGGIGIDYVRWGGPTTSELGYPTGPQIRLGSALMGWRQDFQNGSIYWSPPTGSVRVLDPFAGAFAAAGGPFGSGLGYPLLSRTSDGTQAFQFGSITATGGAPVISLTAPRGGRFADGSAMPTLGAQMGVRVDLGSGTWLEQHASGVLYGSAAGEFWVGGGIGARYLEAGGPAGSGLGFPTGFQYPLGDTASGWRQSFEHGAIYWSPKMGAQFVFGDLAAGFERAGGPTGTSLGYPTTDTATTDSSGTAAQVFENGTFYWSAATGGWGVPGGIGIDYARLGGPAAPTLGRPTGAQLTFGDGGWAQAFENGFIYWTGRVGSRLVTGVIGAAYLDLNGARGSALGYPLADAVAVGSGWMQIFDGGRIYWSSTGGTHVTSGGIGIDYVGLGAHTGSLGLPLDDQYAVGDGGWAQRFQGGTAYWHPSTGTHLGLGGIGDYFAGIGGSYGSGLGYPTGEQYPIGYGYWVQKFHRGSITWVPNFGGVVG